MDVLSWPSVAQAAQRLDCRTQAIYNAILRGRLHAEKCALGILIEPTSLEHYAATRRTWRQKGSKVA
jgi:hypothetical protein